MNSSILVRPEFSLKSNAGLLFSVFLLCTSCATSLDLPHGRLIDLTHPFNEETIYWPTEPGFVLEKAAEGVTAKGYFYYANRFRAAEHGGTHLDAPRHFSKTGQTVDQIPLTRFLGKGILVDVSQKCVENRDYEIRREDFLEWERREGKIPKQAIVLLRTGFGRYWPDRVQYLGTDERGEAGVRGLHFPGLHPAAARWLLEARDVKAVGIDTASIDFGQSERFETHVVLSEKNAPILENLANLDQLPPKGFVVLALPMKIKGGSGAPTRVLALVD